ncbi:MAG: hypothetical protein GDA51_08460, partial [Ekhidna sp.]|nr:hypothetical protein [Ekhidna sp.]
DGDGVSICFIIGVRGRCRIGMCGDIRSVPPVYGVVVGFPINGRDGNGFVVRGCLPCGDEGFRVGLCLPEEREEEYRDY